MLKLEENPPILFPEGLALESIPGQWYVAHTKARNEKALAWSLHHWNIAYFLPLIPKKTRRKGRLYQSLLPLFGGYLFFCGEQEKRYIALTTNRIANVIDVVDQAKLVQQLCGIHRAITSGLPVDTHPYLKAGDRCRVTAGPLIGHEGIVVRKNKLTRILLQIDILGQAAAVEIDADLLESL